MHYFMVIWVKLQYKIPIIPVHTCCSCQENVTYLFACSSGTGERFIGSGWGRGAECVAGIWFEIFQFKMIRLKWFVFIPFRCVSFGCARF